MAEQERQGRNRVKHLEDLEVWQLGRELVLAVYEVTASFPYHEIYGLTAQIRRASVSVPANMAEGFGRYHYRDKVRFLLQARGSLHELKSHLLIAQALGFISNEGLRPILTLLQNLNVKINNLIAGLRTRASHDSTTASPPPLHCIPIASPLHPYCISTASPSAGGSHVARETGAGHRRGILYRVPPGRCPGRTGRSGAHRG